MKSCPFFLIALIASGFGSLGQAQVSGSIHSTDGNGSGQNIFKSKKSVYLSTVNCSTGLSPDGVYVFQVTDPSGAVLLSLDDISRRRFEVKGGLIDGVLAPGHATKNGPCGSGSKIIKLAEFDTTPSNSGEYKIWVTREEDYTDPSLIPGVGFHGFLADASKTDNFKVKGGKPTDQTVIHGTVFYDFQDDGIFDPQQEHEVPLAGWRVEIDSGGATTVTYTGADGNYEFIRDMDGSPHVLASVAPPPGFVGTVGGRWLDTTPRQVAVFADAPEIVVDFGNVFLINTQELATSKGYWHNQGKAELQACDPEWRTLVNGLCLRQNFTIQDPGVSEQDTIFQVSTNADFDTAFYELSNYLVGDPALGVKAFILSTQYCAAMLNSNCGPLQGLTTYIDQEFDDVLVNLDTMAANTLALLCDPCSADTGPGGDPDCIATIEQCLDEWGDMNSNEGSSVFTRAEEGDEWFSPY